MNADRLESSREKPTRQGEVSRHPTIVRSVWLHADSSSGVELLEIAARFIGRCVSAKAEYGCETDSGQVERSNGEKPSGKRVKSTCSLGDEQWNATPSDVQGLMLSLSHSEALWATQGFAVSDSDASMDSEARRLNLLDGGVSLYTVLKHRMPMECGSIGRRGP